MIKIPGHSGICENEYIDKMIKDAHNDNYLSLEIKYDDIDNLNAIPRWNNVIINQNLRKFISLISKVKGFEKFFNLGRNAKYRKLEVDWKLTFEMLNSDSVTTLHRFPINKDQRKENKTFNRRITND